MVVVCSINNVAFFFFFFGLTINAVYDGCNKKKKKEVKPRSNWLTSFDHTKKKKKKERKRESSSIETEQGKLIG